MRIAYLTTDEVNQDLALRLAADGGLTLCPRDPRDPPPDGEFDAVLYDWDSWPADQKKRVLTGLLAGPVLRPVALHSYGLEESQAEALRRNGVLIFDRLEPETLRAPTLPGVAGSP
jgi:hypothetical protein